MTSLGALILLLVRSWGVGRLGRPRPGVAQQVRSAAGRAISGTSLRWAAGAVAVAAALVLVLVDGPETSEAQTPPPTTTTTTTTTVPLSDDATLSDLTVDGTTVPGFHKDRFFGTVVHPDDPLQTPLSNPDAAVFHVPIHLQGSNDDTMVLRAVASDSGATITFDTSVNSVDSEGGSTASSEVEVRGETGGVVGTFTVTAEDSTTVYEYKVSLNGGVDDTFGWNVDRDIQPVVPPNEDWATPKGIWSDGETTWVADSFVEVEGSVQLRARGVLYAYRLSDSERDPSKDLILPVGVFADGAMWSDGEIMWMSHTAGLHVYAVRLSDGQRLRNREFTADRLAGTPASPGGIWSDGETMWITNIEHEAIYAYDLDTRARDADEDFEADTFSNTQPPTGIWSNGTTMWVADEKFKKILAFDLETKERVSDLDFDTLDAAGHTEPWDLWSDGEVMWVIDRQDERVFSYNMPSDDASLSGVTVGGVGVGGFDPGRRSYHFGVGRDVDEVVVAAAANDSEASVKYVVGTTESTDASVTVDLAGGANVVEVVVTAEAGNSVTYTLSVNRGSSAVLGWAVVGDLDTLVAAGNRSPAGIWSDGATVWVADTSDDKLFAYGLSTKQRDAGSDIELASDNGSPAGVWSDGTTVWVVDSVDDKLYAYGLLSRQRDAGRDISLAAGNDDPWGVWSDGELVWVGDTSDDELYAYRLSGGSRVAGRDVTLTEGRSTRGIWSDDTTLWGVRSGLILAFGASDGAYIRNRSIRGLPDANGFARGLWSDGRLMLVTDSREAKVFSYWLVAPSDDASLSGVTVDGVAVPGFDPDRRSYEFGVSGASERVTVAAAASDSRALVTYVVDGVETTGESVTLDLASGANVVKVVVTAEATNTVTYTLTLNRGSTADFEWAAVGDFDTLAAAGNGDPAGVWSNGATMWVTDTADDKLYAYVLSTTERDDGKDIDLASGNGDPAGVWSNGTTVWVADTADDKLYAYGLLTRQRDAGKDISLAAGNDDPWGVWSDGALVWVADSVDDKLYAYRLSGGSRVAGRDLALPQTFDARGIWSDGETVWEAHSGRVLAYRLSDGQYQRNKSIQSLLAANGSPSGIWSDGELMWVADTRDDKIYSYNLPSFDASLRALTVDGAAVAGFGPDRLSYHHPVGGDVTSVVVAAAANHPGASLKYVVDGNDSTAASVTLDVSGGANVVQIVVTAEHEQTVRTYTLSVNRSTDAAFGWAAVRDIDTLTAAGNDDPWGLWSDRTTVWVADTADDKLYAYRASDGARDAVKDIELAAGNDDPAGIWSNRTTVWVVDTADDKLYAYRLSTRARDAGKDIELVAGNDHPAGVWSDRTTVWVTDTADDKLYAYRLSTRARDGGKDIELVAGNDHPAGVWSDRATVWVADTADDKLYAYGLSTGQRDADADFDTLAAAGNGAPAGIWSNGAVMWVVDNDDDKVYAYNVPSLDSSLSAVTVGGVAVPGIDAGRVSYHFGVGAGIKRVTVAAAASHPGASVTYVVDGVESGGAGVALNLAEGANAVQIVVTAEAGNSFTYTLWVNRGADDDFGWTAVRDIDTLAAAGNDAPWGIWSDGETMWVGDSADHKLYAYSLSTGHHDPGKDFAVSPHVDMAGIWSPGRTTTLWLLHLDTWSPQDPWSVPKLKFVNWQTGTTIGSITLDDNNDHAAGLWSDHTTIWVVDTDDDRLYAYDRRTRQRVLGPGFALKGGNDHPAGLWSDGETMWVADRGDDKLFAYRLSNGTRDAAKDFNTPAAVGNNLPAGVWSDGETIWVVDRNDTKVYSYWLDASRASLHDRQTLQQAAAEPLTAKLIDTPPPHDGQTAFTFELRLSEEPGPDFSYQTLQDHAFTVTGGEVTTARRLAPPGNVRWEITITPRGSRDVTIVLPATTDCADQGAICTADGNMLSGETSVTVAAAATPLTAKFIDTPPTHDGHTAFTFELRFSKNPKPDFSYETLLDHAFRVTRGEVTAARRLRPPGNRRWEITITPDGNGDVTIVLPATSNCNHDRAICTADGTKLSTRVELTVAGPG